MPDTDSDRKTETAIDRAFNTSSKLPPIIQHAIAAGYESEIVPVAPPGATLSPYSKINAALVGKIPMLFSHHGWHGYGWTKHVPTREELECCAINGGGFGARGDKLVGLDFDVENKEQVAKSIKILHGLGVRAAVRMRDGSPRLLVVLVCKPGFIPLYRRLSWRESNGAEHTVELLGKGKFYVIHGIHPKSKTPYRWHKDIDPFIFPNLTQADEATIETIFTALEEAVVSQGWGTVVSRSSQKHNGEARKSSDDRRDPAQRKSIDDPSRWAPSPQDVLAFMKVWRNTSDNVPTHIDFVAATAAIKTAFGPDREKYYPEFLQWGLEYPGNTKDYVRARWESIA